MIELLLVLLGIHLMIEWLAAAYRIIDLWYDFKRHRRTVLTRLVIISGLGALVFSLLPSEYGHYFMIGAAGYLLIHAAVWLVGRLIALWLERRSL